MNSTVETEKSEICGRKVDTRLVYFIPYIIACFVAMIVAVIGIFTDKEHFNFYSNLLVGTIGYLAPGPLHAVPKRKLRPEIQVQNSVTSEPPINDGG